MDVLKKEFCMMRKNIILVIILLAECLTVIQAQESGEGISVPGASLTEKLTWLQRSADSHNTYLVEVKANENIAPYTFEYSGAINITVVIKGDGTNRIIRLQSHGTMFTVYPSVTFVLNENITLQGHSSNNNAMINVNGGTLIMNAGGTITGNTSAASGGGVLITNGGTFIMNGGTISGNTAKQNGGGIDVNNGSFFMNGGTISGNTAGRNGGGVGVNGGQTFTMRDGNITDNTAREHAGGVYLYFPSHSNGSFTKTGGTITGYSSGQTNGNAVKDDAGALARRGHAVWVDVQNIRKETTAGPEVNLNLNRDTRSGWDS
jgi:hypothetical protein